jgi:MYXO-CTERM domain-containing protein
MALNRRAFLKTALGAPAVLALPRTARAEGYGSLETDTEEILDLPPGFSYVVLDRRDEIMDDGYKVPGKPDGMACFQDEEGHYVLMRNHELDEDDLLLGPYPDGVSAPDEAYDPDALGGVSRMVIDPYDLSVVWRNMVLVGTTRNCAGGPSPWGWLSCEENVGSGHGYVFLCDPTAESVQGPHRIDAYGRFNHEAAAVDPSTLAAYLTEDRSNGCLYRLVPDDPADPFVGTLSALKVKGEAAFDTALQMSLGDVVEVEWVDLDEPTPESDTLRTEAIDKGAATIKRGEGIWFHEDSVWFTATSGGPVDGGQVFRLRLFENTLECVLVSTNKWVLDMPDNITVAPWGEVFFCEDGTADQYVRGIDASGTMFDFAYNAGSTSEIAGVCFSPDGQVMFLNLQKDHMTLAITGPFPGTGGDTWDTASSRGSSSEDGCGCAAPLEPPGLAGILAALGLAFIRRQDSDEQA